MKFQKISSSFIVGTIALTCVSFSAAPATASPVLVTAGVENVVKDSNQQQVIDVFNGINSFRASKGLAPVKYSVPLSGISQKWSDHMAGTDQFYHNPDYVTGVPSGWGAATEIIAARNDRTGQNLVNQWIASPSHNSIMSDPKLNTMGVGIAFTDMSPTDNGRVRYGMYGTANLFQYSSIPNGTYNHPADYFAGKPPLSNQPETVTVTPTPPTANETTYTIPNVEGVKYSFEGYEVRPGTYEAGRYAVTIDMSPKPGYTFPQGTVTRHTFYFEPWNPNPSPQVIYVTPAAPVFNKSDMTYTIPASQGVQYTVNGTNVGAGTHNIPASRVNVTATPVSGYAFTTGATSQWSADYIIQPEPAPAPAFTDLGQTGFVKEVSWMKESGISTGYADGTYRPQESVTREAMAAFLYRLAGKPAFTPPTVSPFADVPKTHPFYKEITWMHASKISTGWADRTYRPYENVSREAMSAFIKRFSGDYCAIPSVQSYTAPSTATFRDSRASGFYKEVEWMRSAGISTGWADGTYRPQESVTREAMAAFLFRTDTLVKNNGGCKA